MSVPDVDSASIESILGLLRGRIAVGGESRKSWAACDSFKIDIAMTAVSKVADGSNNNLAIEHVMLIKMELSSIDENGEVRRKGQLL